jgi:hypothetical protein
MAVEPNVLMSGYQLPVAALSVVPYCNHKSTGEHDRLSDAVYTGTIQLRTGIAHTETRSPFSPGAKSIALSVAAHGETCDRTARWFWERSAR